MMRSGPVVVIALLASLAAASAQPGGTSKNVPNALQGFQQNRGQPVQIESSQLEVRDKDKMATFTGDVKVVQGDTTMRCKSLVVFYEQNGGQQQEQQQQQQQQQQGQQKQQAQRQQGQQRQQAQQQQAGAPMKAATPGPGGSSSITKLEARGGVIVTQKDQTATGETGYFDMKANTVTLVGNVLVSQGPNVVRGNRLVVDLTTGVSRVEGGNSRVQMLIQNDSQSPGSPKFGPMR